MRAAILTKLNAPLELAEVEPLPTWTGQVRVRMLASGICGAQLAEIRGEKGNAGFLPHLLGHEGCGIVEEVGLGVTKVKAGDKVVLHWRKGAGMESDFPRYNYDGREIRSGKVVTFGEVVLASENRVTRVPADTPNYFAALLGCGLSTALATLQHEADFAAGQSLLVIGAGGIGLNLLRAAEIFHAEPVACVDVVEDKCKTVESMGAEYYCKSFPAHEFDVVVDTVGRPETIAKGIAHTAASGKFILVGHPMLPITIAPTEANLFAGEGKLIRTTQGGAFQPERDIPRWVKLHAAGKLKIDGIISHRFPLEKINDALDLVRSGHAGRVLLNIEA